MITPIWAAFWGWLAFNVVMLSMFKDENEASFKFVPYAQQHWDNWAASAVMIPVLIFIGQKGLNIQLDEKNLEWNDLYYLGSGFATEAVKMAYKKFVKR